MRSISALSGGLAGAVALTVLHEVTRRLDSQAPRMDLLGMEAASKGIKAAGGHVPPKDKLFKWALAGDIFSNTLYYSAVSGKTKKQVWRKGALLGLSAGLGAVLLPKPLGLDEKPGNQ